MTPTLQTPQPARHPNPTTKARSLAFLRFERPNGADTERFLTDFGLPFAGRSGEASFYRAADAAAYCYRVDVGRRARFVGLGFEVASRRELAALTQLPGASGIEPLEGPGGGAVVRLTDPSGFQVEAVCGREPATVLPHRAPLPLNLDAPTRINATQRLPESPPEVLRLGHVVLEVADYQATCAWYTQHFGLIPSDVQVLPDGSPAVTFLRLDLGATPADHHTLALAQGVMPTYSHSAYEVVDADAVGMGQRILRERGYTHAWGIGRHILGSQVFDYWKDPFGAKHEHYCDGDLFTSEVPMGVHTVSREAMAQWGPRMPASFTRPPLSPATLARILGHVRSSPDLSLSKLRTLATLFG
ncbi:VOC family protein [Myxococcus sp. K15C18031901]|uniref:VOC family protein n=1 Tax=Myxococcus dinghuensis TaxID=2906761 RepID=UPI0020A79060|nr:VOC family protein [Myxococcus dinghuensis]MCP3103389.1 VOC family protein [Myxococcus dinghuensis]